jgi:hypothetical protein
MANMTLLLSAVCMGSLPVLAILMWRTEWLLSLTYMACILTSIINHTYTSNIWKWGDRSMVTWGTTLDVLHIMMLPSGHQAGAIVLIVTYLSMFFLAKWLIVAKNVQGTGNIPHIMAHCFATILHVWLIWSFRHNKFLVTHLHFWL